MATPAELEASRTNATHSTGPRTPEGKAATGRNVQSDGLPEYEAVAADLWNRLATADPLEELYATEIIRASWRLRRCAAVEHPLIWTDPLDEAGAKMQAAVDRARYQSHSVLAPQKNRCRHRCSRNDRGSPSPAAKFRR